MESKDTANKRTLKVASARLANKWTSSVAFQTI